MPTFLSAVDAGIIRRRTQGLSGAAYDMINDPRASRILDILAAETFVEREKLVPEATIDDLGIASLDIVQAIFALETKFEIEIPIARQGGGAEFATVGELVAHVLAALDASRASAPSVPPRTPSEPVEST
jgi:acyl carrier protein